MINKIENLEVVYVYNETIENFLTNPLSILELCAMSPNELAKIRKSLYSTNDLKDENKVVFVNRKGHPYFRMYPYANKSGSKHKCTLKSETLAHEAAKQALLYADRVTFVICEKKYTVTQQLELMDVGMQQELALMKFLDISGRFQRKNKKL